MTAYELITFVADASFKDCAIKHEELLHLACSYMDEADKRDVAAFKDAARRADFVKAAMNLQWPVATKAWFREEWP